MPEIGSFYLFISYTTNNQRNALFWSLPGKAIQSVLNTDTQTYLSPFV